MSEQRGEYQTVLDNPVQMCDTLTDALSYVKVSRAELEQEHTHLLGRLQQLRRLLGYTPLPTGKQLRREQADRR